MSQSDFVSRGQALVSRRAVPGGSEGLPLGLLGRPTTVEGRVVLGQALLALKRFDEVLAEMRVALELDHWLGAGADRSRARRCCARATPTPPSRRCTRRASWRPAMPRILAAARRGRARSSLRKSRQRIRPSASSAPATRRTIPTTRRPDGVEDSGPERLHAADVAAVAGGAAALVAQAGGRRARSDAVARHARGRRRVGHGRGRSRARGRRARGRSRFRRARRTTIGERAGRRGPARAAPSGRRRAMAAR